MFQLFCGVYSIKPRIKQIILYCIVDVPLNDKVSYSDLHAIIEKESSRLCY